MKQLQEILKPYFADWQTEVDITAVFTYITQNHWDYKSNQEFEDSIDILDCYRSIIWIIPNKPLSLYSPKEEISLLELLLKLK